MNRDLNGVLRANPDVAAIALLIALLAPQLDQRPSLVQLSVATFQPAGRVWQRLGEQLQAVERRLERIAAPDIESEY